MIYCISDIHGEVNRFTAMLDQIHFSTEDTLYIIGDVIDRALGGVDILKQIMAAFNMVLLLGNHEQMCLDTLGPNNVLEAVTCGGRTAGTAPTGRGSMSARRKSGTGSSLSIADWRVCVWMICGNSIVNDGTMCNLTVTQDPRPR